MTDWNPDLTRSDRPRYLAIADLLAVDIERGHLTPGDRLPPQRRLASRLGIDFTTVARGYVEAQKRGLVHSRVGQGTFVRAVPRAERAARETPVYGVDLSMNLPPEPNDPALIERMQAGLAEVSRDLVPLLRYQGFGGSQSDKDSASIWLGRRKTVREEQDMPVVTAPAHQKGDYLVDYEEKVFEDVKAEPGEKALVTFHTVAFEGSIGLVNILQALRLQRKGFETAILLYGPGVTLGVQRGFPKLGDEAFPGAQNFSGQLTKFMAEGGKVYCCRFALQMLYGHGEGALLPGIRPISPLDVLDLILINRRDNAFMLHTWTL
jgi:uncharacterized repeat protein (TIGR04044 family)